MLKYFLTNTLLNIIEPALSLMFCYAECAMAGVTCFKVSFCRGAYSKRSQTRLLSLPIESKFIGGINKLQGTSCNVYLQWPCEWDNRAFHIENQPLLHCFNFDDTKLNGSPSFNHSVKEMIHIFKINCLHARMQATRCMDETQSSSVKS